MASGIYQITCTETGDTYIGAAVDIDRRFDDHVYALQREDNKCEGLQEYYDKHGLSLKLEVLEICPANDLCECEKWWIATLKPTLNKGCTPYQIGKLKPVVAKTPEGNIFNFSSVRQAAAHFSFPSTAISQVCKGRWQQYNKIVFTYS